MQSQNKQTKLNKKVVTLAKKHNQMPQLYCITKHMKTLGIKENCIISYINFMAENKNINTWITQIYQTAKNITPLNYLIVQ